METATVAALMTYVFVMSITPGPNNLLLASSGLVFGMGRTLPHIVGIPTGVICQLLLVGGGLGSLFALEPRVQLVLKVAGTVYLLWLSLKLWKTDTMSPASASQPISFWQAISFQFINPKSWLIALTAISAFLKAGSDKPYQMFIICLAFALIGTPCMVFWAAMGAGLRRSLSDAAKIRRVNRILAIMAAATGLMFWL